MNDLSHHGIKGQSWGVRNGPPYPLDSIISTGKRLKKHLEKKKEESKEKRKAKKEKAREEKLKKILQNPAKLYKYRDKFSVEDINKALKRFEAERKLYDYSKETLKKGADYVDIIVAYGSGFLKLYNIYRKANGAINGTSDNKNDNSNNNKNKSSGDYELDKLREEKARLDLEFEKNRLRSENAKRTDELKQQNKKKKRKG